MRIGKLRHQGVLQQLVAGSPQQKASGEPDTSWATVATVWCAIEPLTGRELFIAQEYFSEVTVRIRLRYRAGVTAGMRCTHEGVVYNIGAVIDWEQRHIELQLLCTTGLNEG